MCKFLTKKDGIYLKEDNEEQKIANYMDLKEIQYNIDNLTYKATLEYKSINGIHKNSINREDYLNRNNLIRLQSIGLDVTHKNVNYLVEYFRKKESLTKVKNVHSKLGFANYDNKKIYKLHKVIGLESEYVGDFDIKPRGNKEEYISMLENEVIGKCELEFALISGLSAVLLAYIGEELGLDTLIIHIVGNSTTGKSTALKLAISCFGYPDVKRSSLYGTYNGTNNALLKKLTGLKGVPYALDEVSMSSTVNFTNFIYTLANGTDKERLNKDSQLKEKETWLTTVLSNGEKSLLDSSNKNAGVQVRVIEASNFTWTKDAENSENINRVILKNYGHIGIEFAKYVMDINKNQLAKEFSKIKNELQKVLEEKSLIDGMTSRRCSKYGIILYTANLFQDMQKCKLDIKGITNMLIKIEDESIKHRSFNKSIIDYIKQYISKYTNKLQYIPNDVSNNTIKNLSKDTIGKITDKEDHVEIQMDKISFEEMIKQGGYEDKNIVLKELKKAKFLNCEKDRFTRCRKNELGYKEDVYVIKIKK